MTKLKQDLNESEDQQTIYTIRLLFKNKPEFPEFDSVNKAVQETFEDTDVVTAFEDIYTFSIPKAEIEIEDGMYAPMMVSLLDAGSIEGKDEVMVDTIGMEIFETSDIQYHFKEELEVSEIITHAYNLAMYQFSHHNPIVSGDTVAGLDDELWQTQYENSLIQPPRIVLDVNINEHAAGNRFDNLKH